jgi:acetyltransferase-like isoleucine patch superfamily enzyme
MKNVLRQLSHDIRFHERLKFGAESNSRWQHLRTFISSRGLWFTLFYRIIYFSTNHKNVRNIYWWTARLLEIPATYLKTILCKNDVLGDCAIEEGVYLSDGGYLTCGARAIGSGSVIHHHITFGMAVANRNSGRPRIGRNVWIGPNSIIAGDIEVGDGCTILPGSYLTYNIAANSVVRGNPARVIQDNFDNSKIRSSLAIIDNLAAQDVTKP